MKACVIMALVACSLLLSGCVFVKIKDDGSGSSKGERVAGNGVITEKTFDVASFSNIKLSVPADVTFETAPDCAVTVKMDENLFEYLTVDVVNGVLKIGSTSPSFRKFKKLAMTITAPGLAYLECNGAVDFEALDGIRGEDFKMVVNGAADVQIAELDAKNVSFEVNGTGDIDVDLVDADKVSLQISGAGDAKLSGKTEAVKVQVNGTGDVDLTRLDYVSLDKRINGVGSVKTGKSRL